MSDESPLLVPMTVEALVVNDDVRTGPGLNWWRSSMPYVEVATCGNGGQPARSGNDPYFNSEGTNWSSYYNGVFLKWRLPYAFTNGVHDNVTGQTTFPAVPNRWLVVRIGARAGGGRSATSWVVESDYVQPPGFEPANVAEVGSAYLTHDGEQLANVNIGRNIALGSWAEPGTSLGLTAVAPGNPWFAYYQPQCGNVFSFVDLLAGQPDQTLSYLVAGWFSPSSADPLSHTTPSDFSGLMTELGWGLADDTDASATASWTIVSGLLTGVSWSSGGLPAGGAPTDVLSVSVAGSSIEALTALVTAHSGDQDVQPELFEAFQLGALHELDQPDGPAIVADRVHTAGFQKLTGGYRWEIVDAPGQATQISSAEAALERAWLTELNAAQADLDAATLALSALQHQLYVMWWKGQAWDTAYPPTDFPGLTRAAIEQALDPAGASSLATQVAAAAAAVTRLAGAVPRGDTPEALAAAVDAYTEARALPPGRVLKRAGAGPFYEPTNPVLLIAGAGASGIVTNAAAPVCRFPGQVVGGIVMGEGHLLAQNLPAGIIPQPDVSGVTGAPWAPDLITSLVDELFLLDPENAASVAEATGLDLAEVTKAMSDPTPVNKAVLPAGGMTAWTENPWHPLLLIWQADYYPIDYGSPESPNWTFTEGSYTWGGAGALAPTSLEGVIQLTPAAVFNMQARLQAFLTNNPGLPTAESDAFNALLSAVQTEDNWDLLSQALNGFNDALLLRQTGLFLDPATAGASAAFQTLLGDAVGSPPNIGDLPQGAGPFSTAFQPWRCGQFYLGDLRVVDEWGQSLRPITENNFRTQTIALPPSFTPTHRVVSDVAGLAELAPGLLQPARVEFDLIPAQMPPDPDEPIAGWVIPNHLSTSLMAYLPNGAALGELAVGVPVAGPPQVCWTAAPGSSYPALDDIARAIPHLGPFLATLATQGPAVFTSFLAAIDETLWTTSSASVGLDESLAVLIGRPLALVRASLQFVLDGPPLPDPSWQFTFRPAPPVITGYQFEIQLGSTTSVEDGLIGYFVGDDYSVCNVVQRAQADSPYLRPIAPGNYLPLTFTPESSIDLSLLVDPRAPVHALCGVLPAKSLQVPATAVRAAMKAMNVTFRVNGVLTDQQVTTPNGGAPVTDILLPVPAERSGTWSWVENDDGAWKSYAIAGVDTKARLSNVLPVLRRGLLQLTSGVGDAGADESGDGAAGR